MTDYTELKRMAEHHRSLGHAYTVATPSAVLALIAENERLSGECEGCPMQVAEELRAEIAGLRTGYQAYERVNAELKAENEALRSNLGAETCKANSMERLAVKRGQELDELRKRIDGLSPFKGAPLTGPDAKCLACGGHHSGLGGLPCPKMSAVAQALSMENQRVTPIEPLRVPHPLETTMGKGEQS